MNFDSTVVRKHRPKIHREKKKVLETKKNNNKNLTHKTFTQNGVIF